MYTRLSEHVFPFLRTLGEGSTYAHYMRDARFTIPTPALLAKVVDLIDHVPMDDRDTKGDVYEYMLGKLANSGQNGQFRTPRHIIRLMVEMTAPTPKDVMCDPAAGTCGFLMVTGEYLRKHYAELFTDPKLNSHYHQGLFHGFENDAAMLRIGSMNMLLHGVENPDVQRRDSLAQDHSGEDEKYTLVLANPPFAGSLDNENVAKDLQRASPSGIGYVDYVLWGRNGKPLGLVEAKRTRRSPQTGQQQAKLYADCLEGMFGQRPVIFYTDGYDHWMWDDSRYPPRKVSGFYTHDELELIMQRRQTRRPLADQEIDSTIVERYYQTRAIRKVAERLERDHQRKALLVMATGAGKTRTVIALCDLLMKAG